jgi:hypothetical protein
MKTLLRILSHLVSQADTTGGAVTQYRELDGHHHQVMMRTYFLMGHKL